MCRLLPKSASATIGRRRINRIGFFLVLPSLPFFYFLCHCSAFYFMSLPDFFFIYVIARLDRAICLSPPSDFPDTPVKPKYDNKKHHHPTGSFLSWPGFLFFNVITRRCPFLSLPDFFFIYVIARLDRAIRLSLSQSAELNFPFFQNKIHCLFHQIKE